jgi:hypothetical protein
MRYKTVKFAHTDWPVGFGGGMLAPGEYSDALRAVGRFLQDIGATDIHIMDRDDLLEISWSGPRGPRAQRMYTLEHIQALRTTAQLYRGVKGLAPHIGTEELLRTIGRQLDEARVRRIGIVETPEGFLVTSEGNESGQEFPRDALVSRAKEERARRDALPQSAS